MVRKITIYFALALTVCAICAPSASAYSVYADGNISNTYTVYFEDIVERLNPSDDYVYFRSGQYDYTLVVGNLEYQDKFILSVSEPVKIYNLSFSQAGYNNSIYNYSVTTDNNFSLNCGNYLIYSNLGDFPVLTERSDIYAYCSLVVLVIIGLCCVLRSIFSYCYRSRRL